MEYPKNQTGLDMFYHSMKMALEQNESEKEDSWVRCEMEFLEEALIDEFNEYVNAEDHDKKADELVDVANFCMMLYHRHIELRNIERDKAAGRKHIKNIFF